MHLLFHGQSGMDIGSGSRWSQMCERATSLGPGFNLMFAVYQLGLYEDFHLPLLCLPALHMHTSFAPAQFSHPPHGTFLLNIHNRS